MTWPPQIDDPLDVVRRLRHGRDIDVADDLPHLEDLQTELLFRQGKRQILALPRGQTILRNTGASAYL